MAAGRYPLRRTPDALRPGRPAGPTAQTGGAVGTLAARRLGREVRAWREARGLSQQELAARLGVAQPNLAAWRAAAWPRP